MLYKAVKRVFPLWHLKDTAESRPIRLNRQVEFLVVDMDPRTHGVERPKTRKFKGEEGSPCR